MALKVINLRKDSGRVLTGVVKDVLIQTNENLMSGDPKYNGWKNAGWIEEGQVTIKLEPIQKNIIDGSKFSMAWNFSVEITSLQFYSMLEFEKFNNELCTVNLNGIQTYLKNINMNMSVDAAFNNNGDARIKLMASKRVQKIRDVIDGNPWGALSEPWESSEGTASPQDSPDARVSNPIGSNTFYAAMGKIEI